MIMLFALAAPLFVLPLTAVAVITRAGLSGINYKHRFARFYWDSFCVFFLLRQQWPELCRFERQHSLLNLTTAVAMMGGRFALAIPALAFAACFARQRNKPSSSGNASTDSFLFGVLLTVCLIAMVALSYLPALALGPILERLLFGT